MKCRIPGIVFVMLLPLTAFAGTDVQAEKARSWVRAHAENPDDADNCFRPENPYQLCLYQDKKSYSFHFKDVSLQEPYEPYFFDNGPDYASEGRYRIKIGDKIGFADSVTGKLVIPAIYDCAHPYKNGVAEVGVRCVTKGDGEHAWWIGGRWFRIDTNGLITGFDRTPLPL